MTLPVRHPGRALALLKAKARATAHPADPSWPTRLAEDLRELDADWRESAQVCADAAWTARSTGRSVLGLLSPDQVTAARSDPVTARAYRHLYLSALRYDFRCPTLQAFVEQLPDSTLRSLDCYSRALYAFALLGQSRPEGLNLMDEVVVEAGEHTKTLHCCTAFGSARTWTRARSGSSPSAPDRPSTPPTIRSCSSAWPAPYVGSAVTTKGSQPSTRPWIFYRRGTSRCTPIWCASAP